MANVPQMQYPHMGALWSPGLVAIDAEASDDDDLTAVYRGFHCDTDGAVHFAGDDGSEDTITVVAGMFYPYAIKRLYATGTTATGIHGIK